MPCQRLAFTADAGAAEPPPPPPPGPTSSRCWPALLQASRCFLSMLLRALVARQPPSLRPAVFARASSSSSGPPGQPRITMDPLDRQQTADRLASGAQASASGGSGAVAAGARVAVAQMTSGSSTDANFQTVSRLAQVRSWVGPARAWRTACCRFTAVCCTTIVKPALVSSTLPSPFLDPSLHHAAPASPAPFLFTNLLQDAVAHGCKMLFLPENVSFLGTSFTEASGLRAQAAELAPLAASSRQLGSIARQLNLLAAGCWLATRPAPVTTCTPLLCRCSRWR